MELKKVLRSKSKLDILVVAAILAAVAFATYSNLQVALRRARDFQRKEDVRRVANGVSTYQDSFGFFPISKAGQIVACEPVDLTGPAPVFSVCVWGKDNLKDLSDPGFPAFIDILPSDPRAGAGRQYYYVSDGRHFQMYAALESADEDEYDPKIVSRGLMCGNMVCNFGLSSGVPLDKSIQEYENEITAKKKQ